MSDKCKMCGTEFTPVLDDNKDRRLEFDRDALREELERVKATLAHIYELAITEDGLADFDADSIRDAWMGYVSREEYDEKREALERVQKREAAMRHALELASPILREDSKRGYDEVDSAYNAVRNALSGDAGSSYISKADVTPLVEALKKLAEGMPRGLHLTESCAMQEFAKKALAHAKSKGLL